MYGVVYFNAFPDEQLNLFGIVRKQVGNFSSLNIFCLGCNTISRRAARRLIVLHPERNIESEQKWQTYLIFASKCNSIKMQRHKNAMRQLKG